jgi:serine/threonine-protein kinase
MPIDCVPTLLDVLRRVRILSADQANEVARELGHLGDDPKALADCLVQIDWLTVFQRDLIFEGRWDELLLGPYSLLAPLGQGGVSQVYRAWDTARGREVVLKVLRQDLARPTDGIRQFERELRAVTLLNHPNIIKTFDANQEGAIHYFAMEFVEGIDLDKFVKKSGPLPVEQACDFIRQVAQGLQHAHQVGLVHRDVKPANLFLIHPPVQGKQLSGGAIPRRGPDPIVKILDWGLARMMPKPGEVIDPTGASTDTEKGMLIGTADYIAPEQARDASLVDTRADIYSLGCTFYFLLTGHPTFTGTSLMQKLMQHQRSEPPPIQSVRPDVPDEVASILQKMLAKSPEDRFQIPLLVVAALRRFCAAPGSGSRTSVPVVLARPSANGTAQKPPSSVSIGAPPQPSGDSTAGQTNGTGSTTNGTSTANGSGRLGVWRTTRTNPPATK